MRFIFVFFFKQKTAYEMRISNWSSDVCSSDLSPEDFPGHTLGVWFFGNEYPFLSWMAKLGIPTDGSDGGVTVLKQGFNVDPLLQQQASCVSTMTYNEYRQVIDAGLTPEDRIVYKYEAQGVLTLEDALPVLEDNLVDPAFVDKRAGIVQCFLRETRKRNA